MEKNIVCLDLVKYHELYEFKQKMADENTHYVYSLSNYTQMIITKDTGLLNIIKCNNEYRKKLLDLEEILKLKENELKKMEGKLKKLSYCPFRKWCNS
jgi:hypothetical protein